MAYSNRPFRSHLYRPFPPALPPSFPHLTTVIPAPHYRPSRVSGNPDGTSKDRPITNRAFLDSRLRGNDGRDAAGITVSGAREGRLLMPLPARLYRPTINSAAHTSPGPGICWPVRMAAMG